MKPADQRKPIATMLDMAKHPVPREMFTILGRKCLIAYPISHLSFLAMIFGYINIITVYRFSVYSSLMTGNGINIALDVYHRNYSNAYFDLSVIVSHIIFGVSFDCYLLNTLKSRENTYALLAILLGLACILVDIICLKNDKLENKRYVVIILSSILGALSHWTSKLGYVVIFLTGNLIKWAEANYKFMAGYSQGGPKLKGDHFMISIILTSTFIGIITALIALDHIEDYSLIPIAITVPIQLHLAGCFEVWGFWKYR